MNLAELTATREALRSSLARYEQINPCCNTCIHLIGENRCSKYDSQPPQDWIDGPVDCQHWHYDGIPF